MKTVKANVETGVKTATVEMTEQDAVMVQNALKIIQRSELKVTGMEVGPIYETQVFLSSLFSKITESLKGA